MILFFNIFLTPNTLQHHYFRGDLKTDDKVDVFKRCISSIAPLYDWKRVVIQFKLDKAYQHRQDELINFLAELFKNRKEVYLIHNFRNENQNDWKNTYEKYLKDDELIFYSCNHDHIFFDYSDEYFKDCIESFKILKNNNAILALSHYPEMIQANHNFENWIEGKLLCVKRLCFDSFLVITRKFFETIWVNSKLGDAFLPRSDMVNQGVNFVDKSLNQIEEIISIPSRELFRHYDGYSGRGSQTFIYNKHFPPITIDSYKSPESMEFVGDFLDLLVGKDSPRYNFLYSEHEQYLKKHSNFRGETSVPR